MNLQELAQHAMERAKEISLKGAQVSAACLILADEKLIIMGLPQYAEHKDIAIASMKAAIEHYQADLYCFVCEAWIAMPKSKAEREATKKPDYAPSRDPKRFSCIIANAKARTGERAVLIVEIKKRGSKTVFKDIDVTSDMQMMGVLDNLFGELGKPS